MNMQPDQWIVQPDCDTYIAGQFSEYAALSLSEQPCNMLYAVLGTRKLGAPVYGECIGEGPFQATVRIPSSAGGHESFVGVGRTKKIARADAARKALTFLGYAMDGAAFSRQSAHSTGGAVEEQCSCNSLYALLGAAKLGAPVYSEFSGEGPFQVAVRVPCGGHYQTYVGKGRTKKAAKNDAASRALAFLEPEHRMVLSAVQTSGYASSKLKQPCNALYALLGEWKMGAPNYSEYQAVSAQGPFQVAVRIPGKIGCERFIGEGRTKKEAKNDAARRALSFLVQLQVGGGAFLRQSCQIRDLPQLPAPQLSHSMSLPLQPVQPMLFGAQSEESTFFVSGDELSISSHLASVLGRGFGRF